MDEEYDAIVLGTGLKECIISGLLSVAGKKVLHMDKNSYYGGESASLTPLKALYEFHDKHPKSEEQLTKEFGKQNDWNVDIIPKLIMANGELVKMLIHSTVTKYLEFKSIEGSYVFYKNKLSKIPASDQEALTTDLVGFLKKKRFAEFVTGVIHSGDDGSVTKKGYIAGMTSRALFELYHITDLTDVCGHAIALNLDDEYLGQPCEDTVKRLKLYFESVSRYGKSPYLYPLYGLGELPQGFARLSAVHGGTYMLNKPIEEIVMDDGKVAGVKSEGETARAKMVIGDPTYFTNLVKKTGEVVRIICILDHPIIPNKNSVQIIFPCSQLKNRKSDIYVCCVSSAHKVASPGHYIAIASCKVETDRANAERELDVALEFLKPIKEKFVKVADLYEPVGDGKDSNIFITTSYDATTHFESTCRDIIDVYKRATGEKVDFSKMSSQLEPVE